LSSRLRPLLRLLTALALSRLSDAQIKAQERLRALLTRGIELRWIGLGSYDEEDVGPWLQAVVPLVLAAQRQSVTLTDAYVARTLLRQPLGLNPLAVIDALRGPSTPDVVYRRPFVHVWMALSKGQPWDQAVAAGLERAKKAGQADVQMAQRAVMQAIQDREPRIKGWVREPDGDACDFCMAIAGAFVKSASAAPLHPGCGCTLVPVEYDQKPDPLPPMVAVYQHGELGPTLADPAHSHTDL
jgi:hypothetical protein